MEAITLYRIQIDKRGDDFVLIEQGITGPDNMARTEVHSLTPSLSTVICDLLETVRKGEMLEEIKNLRS